MRTFLKSIFLIGVAVAVILSQYSDSYSVELSTACVVEPDPTPIPAAEACTKQFYSNDIYPTDCPLTRNKGESDKSFLQRCQAWFEGLVKSQFSPGCQLYYKGKLRCPNVECYTQVGGGVSNKQSCEYVGIGGDFKVEPISAGKVCVLKSGKISCSGRGAGHCMFECKKINPETSSGSAQQDLVSEAEQMPAIY